MAGRLLCTWTAIISIWKTTGSFLSTTREDWEAERREWEERNRKFNEEWAAREAAGQPAFSPDNFAIDTWDFDAELEEKSLTDDDDDDQGKLVC